MPVISNLVYTVTDTTIVATWTTDVSSDSNLSAGGKAAIDNGVAANSTSHQAIVCGLSPNTVYSCFVTSGGTSSTSQNVTTNASPTRTVLKSIQSFGTGTSSTNHGDTNYTFVSSDNNTYITECDGQGFVSGTPNAGANAQLGVLTNESTLVGTAVNLLTGYGGQGTSTGTDGPSGSALTNKITGLFGMLGNLYLFMTRQGSQGGAWYNNVIMSTNKGATWNNYQATSTFTSGGTPINTSSFPLPSNTYGFVSPIRYAADDGTLGYNTAGNGIDGANGYVYQVFVSSPFTSSSNQYTPAYLLRIPRIQFAAQTYTGIQYWVGPSSPAPSDFVNDSNWSSSNASLTAITNPATPITWPIVTFIAGINSYLMVGDANGIPSGANTSLMYAAPTPAGPWSQIYSNPDGGLLLYGFMPMHRDCFGNSATNNIPIRVIYSGGEGNFTTNYFPTIVTVTLSTTTMANTFIQGTGTTTSPGNVNPMTLAYGSNVTGGNLLVVSFRHGNGSTVSSVTDTIGSTWTVVYDNSDGFGTYGGWAWAFARSSGANTVSVNFVGLPGGGTVCCIAEWNGPNTKRATSTVATGNSTALLSNAITATAGDLLVGIGESNVSQASFTPGSGYTQRSLGKDSGVNYCFIQDNLGATGGSTTSGATMASMGYWTAGIGAFYFAAGSGGSGSFTQRHRHFINKR
jgi:hypothetical protein